MSDILRLAVDVPLRRLFDYRAPPGVDPAQLVPGVRLWVPFGRRRVVGVLVERPSTTDVPAGKLRAAAALIDETPVIDSALLELLRWSADYYHHAPGEVIAAALPAPLRSGAPALGTEERWTLTAAARAGELPPLSARAGRLREMVEALEAHGAVDVATLAVLSTRWREHLRELEKRGWAMRLQVAPALAPRRRVTVGAGPEPMPEQARAIEAIAAAAGRFAPFLLHGVTGSGKTEVYLRAIAEVVGRGRQALVLVPEIALTPQLVARFAERFDAPLAVLHSALPDQERLRAWRAARSGEAPVVIGTRSAIFAPLARPGLIVVDEEHDPSYKQQEGFRYSARDLALARGAAAVGAGGARLGHALARKPRARAGRARDAARLPARTGGASAPPIHLIDLRRHAATQGIATPVVLTIKRHLDAGGQVLLFLNRRGYAPTLFCPACGWVGALPALRRAPDGAPARGAPALPPLRQRAAHPRVVPAPAASRRSPWAREPNASRRRWRSSSQTRRSSVSIATRCAAAAPSRPRSTGCTSGAVRLLVGTQMLTKGHHFPDVSLVVVLNADQGLFGTDFRASERLAQTIVQVAGRAGAPSARARS